MGEILLIFPKFAEIGHSLRFLPVMDNGHGIRESVDDYIRRRFGEKIYGDSHICHTVYLNSSAPVSKSSSLTIPIHSAYEAQTTQTKIKDK